MVVSTIRSFFFGMKASFFSSLVNGDWLERTRVVRLTQAIRLDAASSYRMPDFSRGAEAKDGGMGQQKLVERPPQCSEMIEVKSALMTSLV